MTEHQPITIEEYIKLKKSSNREFTSMERDRVWGHLLHSDEHENDGYLKAILSSNGRQLWRKFEDDVRAHQAAILRGETTAEDLWPGEMRRSVRNRE